VGSDLLSHASIHMLLNTGKKILYLLAVGVVGVVGMSYVSPIVVVSMSSLKDTKSSGLAICLTILKGDWSSPIVGGFNTHVWYR
jgi:hypothetical protein